MVMCLPTKGTWEHQTSYLYNIGFDCPTLTLIYSPPPMLSAYNLEHTAVEPTPPKNDVSQTSSRCF